MSEVCLDTSVWIKLWVAEDGSAAATQLMQALLAKDWDIVAPPTLAYEVATVFRQKVRRRLLESAEAEEAWEAFRAFPLRVNAELGLVDSAWLLARRLELPTAYDAAFLAAARGGPLVTADQVFLACCRCHPDLRVLDLSVAEALLFGASAQ